MENLPENPLGIVAAILLAVLGWFSRGWIKKSDNSTSVELAKINYDKEQVEELTKKLEAALKKVEELEEEGTKKDLLIQQQSMVIQYSKALMNILYKNINTQLGSEKGTLAILEQVKEIFDKH